MAGTEYFRSTRRKQLILTGGAGNVFIEEVVFDVGLEREKVFGSGFPGRMDKVTKVRKCMFHKVVTCVWNMNYEG